MKHLLPLGSRIVSNHITYFLEGNLNLHDTESCNLPSLQATNCKTFYIRMESGRKFYILPGIDMVF